MRSSNLGRLWLYINSLPNWERGNKLGEDVLAVVPLKLLTSF